MYDLSVHKGSQSALHNARDAYDPLQTHGYTFFVSMGLKHTPCVVEQTDYPLHDCGLRLSKASLSAATIHSFFLFSARLELGGLEIIYDTLDMNPIAKNIH